MKTLLSLNSACPPSPFPPNSLGISRKERSFRPADETVVRSHHFLTTGINGVACIQMSPLFLRERGLCTVLYCNRGYGFCCLFSLLNFFFNKSSFGLIIIFWTLFFSNQLARVPASPTSLEKSERGLPLLRFFLRGEGCLYTGINLL